VLQWSAHEAALRVEAAACAMALPAPALAPLLTSVPELLLVASDDLQSRVDNLRKLAGGSTLFTTCPQVLLLVSSRLQRTLAPVPTV
jgi:hypothetical protein